MQTVLISGGTGMIGKALCRLLLQRGYAVIVLTRKIPKTAAPAGLRYARWNVATQEIDLAAVKEADYILHLAGAGVADKRWTARRKKEIVSSRTQSSALLVKALRETPHRVKAVVSTSAIGWYGPDASVPNNHPFKETDPSCKDFLGETCAAWEDSIATVKELGCRLVVLRLGVVLSSTGGALQEFMKPLRLGIAAILGSGRQIISWAHIDDVCRAFTYAIENEMLSGAYNVAAPQPSSNKNLTLELAKRKKGKFYIPIYVPAFVLKLVLGEMSVEVLKSATVSSAKLRDAGFSFAYPSLEAALGEIVRQ